MEIVIYGSGPLTIRLLPSLVEAGHQIAVLGDDPDQLAQIPDHPNVDSILTSEPLMHDYLRQAGVSSADAFLALSPDDHSNLMVAQIARHIFNVPAVICHVQSPYLQQTYAEMGLRVLGPHPDIIPQLQQGILD